MNELRAGLKGTAAVFATILAAVLLGPFWWMAPIVAATIFFSPRIMRHRKWTLRDEGREESEALRSLRKELDR